MGLPPLLNDCFNFFNNIIENKATKNKLEILLTKDPFYLKLASQIQLKINHCLKRSIKKTSDLITLLSDLIKHIKKGGSRDIEMDL